MSKLRSSRRARLAVALAAVGIAVVGVVASGSSASAAGDYGPDTCLEGYVWRDAFAGDHVCVTGAARTQAAADNRAAAGRRNPNGGPYGPDTCLMGYVWREANSTDHVCVSGVTRSQTWSDNGQSAARRDSILVSRSTYTVPPRCNGETCTSTSTDDIPRFRLRVDHINVATATVVLRRTSNNALVRSWRVYAAANGSAPGGVFQLDTGVFNCAKSTDSYFQVYDPISTRWSARQYVSANCAVL